MAVEQPSPIMQAIELARALAAPAFGEVTERRTVPRYSLITVIRVQLLDDKLKPLGVVCDAANYSLSTKGMGFVHTVSLRPSSRLLIEIPHTPPLRVVGEVVRCRAVAKGFYDIGVRLLQKLPSDEATSAPAPDRHQSKESPSADESMVHANA